MKPTTEADFLRSIAEHQQETSRRGWNDANSAPIPAYMWRKAALAGMLTSAKLGHYPVVAACDDGIIRLLWRNLAVVEISRDGVFEKADDISDPRWRQK